MLVKSKFFPQIVEKIEKLKLNLSKQHNKMLKMRSEMLKTRKKGKTIKRRPGNTENFWDPGIPGNFFENFPFSGNLKIREKGETLFVGNGPKLTLKSFWGVAPPPPDGLATGPNTPQIKICHNFLTAHATRSS